MKSYILGLKVSPLTASLIVINYLDPFFGSCKCSRTGQVDSFIYLGSHICSDGSSDIDVKKRLQKHANSFFCWSRILSFMDLEHGPW